ncbi:MAG: VWA domain-containing protein [Chitinophagaceae bacterium]
MLRFQHPEYLYGLVLLIIFLLFFLAVLLWKRRSIKKIGDPELVEQLFTGYSLKRYRLKFILLFFAFFLGVIGLANPQMGDKMEKITRKGVDVVIALDVSKSMLSQDVQPDRLERAKQLVNDLLDKMSNDRVGLVVFAGNAYLQMPLTVDFSAARMYLHTVNPDMVPTPGTDIGQAIARSNEAFDQQERKHKAIILITDGEDHDPTALEETQKAFADGVVVHTVGIGSVEGSPILDPDTGHYMKDSKGQTVISRLNQKELEEIAAAGHGIYQHLDNPDEVAKNLEAQLEKMGQKEYGENIFTDYKSYFQYFLGVALVLLLMECFIPEVKKPILR